MSDARFNRRIYKKEAIEKAISDFSHLAKFNVTDNKRYINVKIKKINSEVRHKLKDEFANYVLMLTKDVFRSAGN